MYDSASNIKKGVTIFGVTGTWTGWVDSNIYIVQNGNLMNGAWVTTSGTNTYNFSPKSQDSYYWFPITGSLNSNSQLQTFGSELHFIIGDQTSQIAVSVFSYRGHIYNEYGTGRSYLTLRTWRTSNSSWFIITGGSSKSLLQGSTDATKNPSLYNQSYSSSYAPYSSELSILMSGYSGGGNGTSPYKSWVRISWMYVEIS